VENELAEALTAVTLPAKLAEPVPAGAVVDGVLLKVFVVAVKEAGGFGWLGTPCVKRIVFAVATPFLYDAVALK